MYMYIYMCVCVYVCMYVCMYACANCEFLCRIELLHVGIHRCYVLP